MRIWQQLQEEMGDPNAVAPPQAPEQEAAPEPEHQPLLPGVHQTTTQVKTLATTRALLVSVVNDLASISEAFGKAEGMSTKPEVTAQVSDVHTSALKLAATVHKLVQELGQ